MSTCTRYHVLPGKDGSTVLIFDSHTGAIQYPACWQDLAAYYNYLLGRGRIAESQKLLADCMAGNKPISAMLDKMTRAEAVPA
jgi:hypothetical protein